MLKIDNYHEITNENSYYIVTLKYDKDFPLLNMNFDIDNEVILVEGIRFVVTDCLVSDNGEWINLICDKEDIDILHLAAVAQDFYASIKKKWLPQGWVKYIVTNGETTLLVDNEYEPKSGEAVFHLECKNFNIVCQLYKRNP